MSDEENIKKNNLSILGIIIVGLIIFLIIAITIFKYSLNSMVNERLELIQASGAPVSLNGLEKKYYAPIPDEENAALIYEEAFAEYKDVSDVYALYLKEENAKGVSAEKRMFKNENDYDKSVLIAGLANDLCVGASLPKKVKYASELYIKANKKTLELLRKASEFSKCRFDLNFKKGFYMQLMYLSPARNCAKLLALNMIVNAYNGNSDAVLKDFIVTLKLSSFTKEVPLLISVIVGHSISHLALDSLEISFNKVKFTDLQLRQIIILLQNDFTMYTHFNVIYGECILCNQILSSKECLSTFFYISRYTFLNKLAVDVFCFTGLNVLCKLKLLEILDELLCILNTNDSVFEKNKKLDILNKKIKSLPFICNSILPFDNIISYTKYVSDSIAKLNTALLVLTIERYRLKYHRLPDNLRQLVPEFINKIPLDPFSGKPYIFRIGELKIPYRTDDNKILYKKKYGLTVYSIGEDGIDDNGNKSPSSLRNGDIPFRVLKQK